MAKYYGWELEALRTVIFTTTAFDYQRVIYESDSKYLVDVITGVKV